MWLTGFKLFVLSLGAFLFFYLFFEEMFQESEWKAKEIFGNKADS